LPTYDKHSTRDHRTNVIDNKLVPRFGEWLLSDITRDEVKQFFADLQRAGAAPHSLYGYRAVFHLIMQDAVSSRFLERNPVEEIRLPRLRPVRPQWALTPQEAGRLVGELSTKYAAMISLAIANGFRRGELLAFRWENFNELTEELQVTHAFYREHLSTPKTEKSQRRVALDPGIVDLLKDWRSRSAHTTPQDLIFATRTGNRDNDRNILRRYVFPACDRLGIKHSSWHTFRRTFLTWGKSEGIDPKILAEMMGHAHVKTQEIYQQPVEGEARAAARKIAGKLLRFRPDRSQPALPFANEAAVAK